MSDSDHIEPKEHLSQYSQISTAIFHMLSVAKAGGLDENKAETMYYEILDAYSTLDGEAFWPFRDELVRILVTPDDQLSTENESGEPKFPGRN